MPRSQLTVLTCAVRIILLFTAYISFRHAGTENGTSTIPLQKGGVPAAPSGTATLLRLSPNHRLYPRAPLAVTHFKARERIHRAVADARLLANPASWSRVADSSPY